ncbi:DUF4282 domain-containing protein [Thiomicrorhabdus xiamenensis]|uniref:DUF4282 domain-containing protein n=1 Tax=Thiomicrorhabdus xiamenensis TaxID=2739063 RepID=A0A7D4SJM7_9GAMM|nr:DUF4282 domain-containing protein [Thiomicrorhabdus xiamenensis]QKI90219.1 DUF4282 domain-containing protein [Thiomicrorhabdus xiamenensis]
MYEFLTFKRLISIDVLIVFYYLGAVVMPLLIYSWLSVLYRKYLAEVVQQSKPLIRSVLNLSAGRRWRWVLLGVLMFLFAELLWRLMFEYLIAFMQMRDALVMPA